jgi:hypothetical protein
MGREPAKMHSMLGLIVLAIIGAIVWKLWAPGMGFVPAFGALLARPSGSHGLWPFAKGVETVNGEYQGRPVLLILHHKRGRNALGYLVVAMQPPGADIAARYSGAFREWIREPAARAAWDDLELQHELKLSFAEGWMRATWQPHGALIFPGRFEPERWQRVLKAMHTVVSSL